MVREKKKTFNETTICISNGNQLFIFLSWSVCFCPSTALCCVCVAFQCVIDNGPTECVYVWSALSLPLFLSLRFHFGWKFAYETRQRKHRIKRLRLHHATEQPDRQFVCSHFIYVAMHTRASDVMAMQRTRTAWSLCFIVWCIQARFCFASEWNKIPNKNTEKKHS